MIEIKSVQRLLFFLIGCLIMHDAFAADRVQALVLKQLSNHPLPEPFVKRVFFDSHISLDNKKIIESKMRTQQLFDGPSPEFYRERIANGIKFYAQYKKLLHSIAHSYGINPFVILAIIGVETNYGAFLGRHKIMDALYTRAVTEPEQRKNAVKELAEFLRYCHERKIDPHSIVGSYAGAFGYGQFLPSSFNYYGVSPSGNKYPRHDSWPDTIASIANYLKKHGYCNYDKNSIYRAIRGYNHRPEYVTLVIRLSTLLEKTSKS